MNKTIINLVKVSGMCAILYGVLWVASMVVAAAGTPFGDPDDMGQYLLEVNAAQTAYLVSNWLAVISHIVGLPVALGFYHVLRRWGALLGVGVLAFIMGASFLSPPTFYLGRLPMNWGRDMCWQVKPPGPPWKWWPAPYTKQE